MILREYLYMKSGKIEILSLFVLYISEIICTFAPVMSPRLGIMSLRVGDYKT